MVLVVLGDDEQKALNFEDFGGFGDGAKWRSSLDKNFSNPNKEEGQPLKWARKGCKREGNAPKLSLPKYPPEAKDIWKNSWTAVKWSKGGSRPARCFS